MKKTFKLKTVALLSAILAMSISQFAFAEGDIVDEVVSETEVVSQEQAVPEKVENPQLRGILKSQKDAQELLNDSNINIDTTLGDIAKYSALTAIQKVKNELEDTVKQDKGQQGGEGDDSMYQNYNGNGSEQPRADRRQQFQNGNQTAGNAKKDVKEEEEVDLKVTAVYTLGNIGYAEINYNGSKTVVKQGGKLPNGAVVESLTPLSVVINNGKDRVTLPIVSESSSKATQSAPQEDFTLNAPRAN